MILIEDKIHSERMRALVDFTATSLETNFPSPFGSAIYDLGAGALVAQAYNTVKRASDPTNHAEINAIREAAAKLLRPSLRGCVLYSTCEPCPMCMSASLWGELEGVVFGASTMDVADLYLPPASDVTPQELISRSRNEPKCILVAHVERTLCKRLLQRCDELRKLRSLQLPPTR